MSTNYYRLKRPITSVHMNVTGPHTRIVVFVNHANAGELCLRNEEVAGFLLAMKSEYTALQKYASGDGKTCLSFEDDGLEPETPLISETGELTSQRQIDPTGKLTEAR